MEISTEETLACEKAENKYKILRDYCTFISAAEDKTKKKIVFK